MCCRFAERKRFCPASASSNVANSILPFIFILHCCNLYIEWTDQSQWRKYVFPLLSHTGYPLLLFPYPIFLLICIYCFWCNKISLNNQDPAYNYSEWTLIGSELSSPNFNSSVRAERSFAFRYLNVVIKPLCGNLDIFRITRPTPTFGRGILFGCFSRGPRPKVKDAFLDPAFRSRSCAI